MLKGIYVRVDRGTSLTYNLKACNCREQRRKELLTIALTRDFSRIPTDTRYYVTLMLYTRLQRTSLEKFVLFRVRWCCAVCSRVEDTRALKLR